MPSKSKAASKQTQQTSGSSGDAWLGILAALPLFVIALVPLLLGVPSTESAGPGWVLPLFLPAGLLLALGPNCKRLGWPHALCLLLAAVVLGRSFLELDSFAARRSAVVWGTSALCFAIGCGIDKRGRRLFLDMLGWLALAGLIGMVICVLLPGHSGQAGMVHWTSLQFGNRGDLAEFLVPAVVFAVAGFLRSHHLSAGGMMLASAALVTWFLGWSPVYAGMLAIFAMTVVGLAGGFRSSASARMGRLLLLTSLVCVVSLGIRTWSASGSDDPGGLEKSADTQQGQDLPNELASDRNQGLQVRLEIWKSTLAMSSAHAFMGVGPGQFRQAFPPYRSQRETELSSQGGRIQNAVEVEHAHNDYLIAIAELGWPLGLLWIALCLWILRKALGNLFEQDRTRIVPSLASVGVLVLSFWNAPLLGPVVSHPLAWLCFGMAMGPMARPRSPRVGQTLALLALALAAGLSPWSVNFLRHGWALSSGPADSEALTSALEIAPDSPLALDFAVHATPPPKLAGAPTQAWLADLRPHFETLLIRRPHSVGLSNDWGRALAIAGEIKAADKAFAHALSLDPKFVPAHRNRVRMNVDQLDLESLAENLQTAQKQDAFEASYLKSWGLFCLRNGRPQTAQVLLQFGDSELTVTDANVCHQQAQFARLSGTPAEENSYLAGEHLIFARDHVAVGAYESAVRSYRQAKRYARRATSASSDPAALRLEMAAAWTLAGQPEEAGKELLGLNWQALTPLERNGLPQWARDVLPIVPK